MKNSLLIIDGMNLLYRAAYSYRNLSNEAGIETGGFYGFIKLIIKYAKNYNSKRIVVAWESKDGNNWRNHYLPEYKKNRNDSERPQVNLIMDLLKLARIPQISKLNNEADDIIAGLCFLFKENIKIVSRDKDMLQLINDEHKIRVVLPENKIDKIFCEKDFIERYEFHPKFMSLYLSIMGDTSDNIPGVPGYGKKRATQLIKDYGVDLIDTDFYAEHQPIIDRNLLITHLINKDAGINSNDIIIGDSYKPNKKGIKKLLDFMEIKNISVEDIIKLSSVNFKMELALLINR